MQSFGQFLRQLRKERSLTQNDIADMLNNDRAEVSRYECDEVIPSTETMIKLHLIFGVTYDELFEPLQSTFYRQDIATAKQWYENQLNIKIQKFLLDSNIQSFEDLQHVAETIRNLAQDIGEKSNV